MDDGDDIQPVNGRRFVAEDTADETVAGLGDVRFDPTEYLSEPTGGGVRAVYVDPDYAGEGVGRGAAEGSLRAIPNGEETQA